MSVNININTFTEKNAVLPTPSAVPDVVVPAKVITGPRGKVGVTVGWPVG